jgi:hypothetical protein
VSADIAAVKAETASILEDTGTTIPAAIDAVPTATENADALLNGDMSAVSDTTAAVFERASCAQEQVQYQRGGRHIHRDQGRR